MTARGVAIFGKKISKQPLFTWYKVYVLKSEDGKQTGMGTYLHPVTVGDMQVNFFFQLLCFFFFQRLTYILKKK